MRPCDADWMGTHTEVSVTWAEALSWRAERHFLDPVGSVSAAGVVHRLGAVLSMDESLAELAVRTRSRTSRAGDLHRALIDGEVINAFAFRGAMHYLSPEDGGVYLALRAAGRQWELPSWVEHYQLRPADWPDFRAAVREALEDGPLTISELGEGVTKTSRLSAPQACLRRGRWHADQAAHLARGHEHRTTETGSAPSSAWPTTRGGAGIPALDDAGPRAIRAYLRTYGPASVDHVHHWLGENLSAGRRRLDRWLSELSGQLVAVDVEGTTTYVLAEDAESLTAARQTNAVRFLPGHDQWVMGPGTKDRAVTPLACREAMTRKANPVIVGGVVRATWTMRKDSAASNGRRSRSDGWTTRGDPRGRSRPRRSDCRRPWVATCA